MVRRQAELARQVETRWGQDGKEMTQCSGAAVSNNSNSRNMRRPVQTMSKPTPRWGQQKREKLEERAEMMM